MPAHDLLMAASGLASLPLYVDDVFKACSYKGTGAAQTITNGIDLAGKGGMVWFNGRDVASANYIHDSVRGFGAFSPILWSAGAQPSSSLGTAPIVANSDGFSISSGASSYNDSAYSFISWTFRKAPKFFDIVQFTVGSNGNRRITHSLGQVPGMIWVKVFTGGGGNWCVYHKGANTPLDKVGYLNTTAFFSSSGGLWTTSSPTASDFGINEQSLGGNGYQCIAYLFADDATSDGIIRCGSYTGTGNSSTLINLGWEPQYVMIKNTSTAGNNWIVVDSERFLSTVVQDAIECYPNSNGIESSTGYGRCAINSDGFIPSGNGGTNSLGDIYIYMAIRRSNKPASLNTEVFGINSWTGTSTTSRKLPSSFPPDLVISIPRDDGQNKVIADRLNTSSDIITSGSGYAYSNSTTRVQSWNFDGLYVPGYGEWNYSASGKYVHYLFKRDPGFLDIVRFIGDGATSRVLNHKLGVAPELMILKNWSYGGNSSSGRHFSVFHGSATNYLQLDYDGASLYDTSMWNSTLPTTSTFTVGSHMNVNEPNQVITAYLFATKKGISKVGIYLGNNATSNIECGFTSGARFILIKPLNNAGNWYVFDSVRGITALNDPVSFLNTVGAESLTGDHISPYSAGFCANNNATVNTSGIFYLYLAIA